MKTLLVCVLLVAGFSPVHAAGRQSVPVVLQSFTGEPADPSARREFMDGFRAAMDSVEFACERQIGDEWHGTESRTNEFRLVDLVGTGDSWALDVSIGVPTGVKVKPKPPKDPHQPPPRARVSEVRSSRGLTIVVAVTSPELARSGGTPTPERFAVYFADARRIVVPSSTLPGGGYDYPWGDAGRVVALASLESLHRANDALNRNERADLAPATRVEVTP